MLLEKRRQLDLALQAIEQAVQVLQPAQEPDWDTFKNILKVIEMQNDNDWMMKYYDDETRAKVDDRKSLWSPELQSRLGLDKQWADLISEVESSRDEDPASPHAQSLADRWQELVRGFTGGDPQIQAGLNKMYADHKNWPTQHKKPYSDAVEAFIRQAMAARAKK